MGVVAGGAGEALIGLGFAPALAVLEAVGLEADVHDVLRRPVLGHCVLG